MNRVPWVTMALAAAAALLRPAPRTSPGGSGSPLDSLRMLDGDASISQESGRTLTGDSGHWMAGAPAGAPDRAAAAHVDAPGPPPLLAATVGLLGFLGLRHAAGSALYLAADQAEARGDDPLHALCLEAAPVVDPHFVQASLLLAWLHQGSDPARSIRILESAARWNPDDWEIHHDLAWIHLRGGPGMPRDLERAERSLARAQSVKHPPFVARLHARVIAARGDGETAIRMLEQVLQDPRLPATDRESGRRLAEAIRSNQDVLPESPGTPRLAGGGSSP